MCTVLEQRSASTTILSSTSWYQRVNEISKSLHALSQSRIYLVVAATLSLTSPTMMFFASLKHAVLGLVAICLINTTMAAPNSPEKRTALAWTPPQIPFHQQRCISVFFNANIPSPWTVYDIRIGREFSQSKCNVIRWAILAKDSKVASRESYPFTWFNPSRPFFDYTCKAIADNHMQITVSLKAGQQVAWNKLLAEVFPVINSIQPFKCLGSKSGG